MTRSHLVPYGEFVPLRRFFPFIRKMVSGIGDFEAGDRLTVFRHTKVPFSVLICYEVIFAEEVRWFVRNGARMLVNITNDAWFGRSAAPFQAHGHCGRPRGGKSRSADPGREYWNHGGGRCNRTNSGRDGAVCPDRRGDHSSTRRPRIERTFFLCTARGYLCISLRGRYPSGVGLELEGRREDRWPTEYQVRSSGHHFEKEELLFIWRVNHDRRDQDPTGSHRQPPPNRSRASLTWPPKNKNSRSWTSRSARRDFGTTRIRPNGPSNAAPRWQVESTNGNLSASV